MKDRHQQWLLVEQNILYPDLQGLPPPNKIPSFFSSEFQIGVNPVILRLGNEWAEARTPILRVTGLPARSNLFELFEKLVIDGLLDKYPRPSNAHLTGIHEDPHRCGGNRFRQIGVSKYDVC